MSGRKRVTIDESRWLAVQKEARQLRQIQRNLPALIRQVRDQTRTDLERVTGELEARQDRVEATAATLSEQSRRLEEDTNRRLRDHVRRMELRLRESSDGIRRETRDALAEQSRELRAEVADLRRRNRAELDRLTEQVGDLVGDADRAARTARDLTADARRMHDLVRDALPHERHAPGRLASLERRLVSAEQHAAEGTPAAAVALAQEVAHGLSELRLEVELAERERVEARATAVTELAITAGLVEENALHEVLDSNGLVIEGVVLDVDHWSNGELATLRTTVADLLARARDDENPLPAQALRQLTESEVPRLRKRLADVVEQAGGRQLSSQLRVNVADVVVQVLDEVAGYELVDSTYAGEDYREAYVAKVAHGNASEIVVEVTPSSDGRFVLRMLSYDHETTAPAELSERASAVARELRSQGLTVSSPEEETGTPDEAMRDMTAIRARKPVHAVERARLQP
jgi:hypothetical protein